MQTFSATANLLCAVPSAQCRADLVFGPQIILYFVHIRHVELL